MRYKKENICYLADYVVLLHIAISNIMSRIQFIMKPQDVVVLLKIIALGHNKWNQTQLAESLKLSQSEISQSLARSSFSRLINMADKSVLRHNLLDFLQYGLTYVFPQVPGPLVRGLPTSHSAEPLNKLIRSSEAYVWPWSKGEVRGHRIEPLYPKVPEAASMDSKLYEMLALIDAFRVGRAREKNLGIIELKKRIIGGEQGG